MNQSICYSFSCLEKQHHLTFKDLAFACAGILVLNLSLPSNIYAQPYTIHSIIDSSRTEALQ